MYKQADVEEHAIKTVLAHYKIAFGGGFLGGAAKAVQGLGSAASRGLGVAQKAYNAEQPLMGQLGNMAQKGMTAFRAQGGMNQAARLGAGAAALGGGAYVAGRGLSAGMQAGQPKQAFDDNPIVGRPVDIAAAVLGASRGANQDRKLEGAVRGMGGSAVGGMLGRVPGIVLDNQALNLGGNLLGSVLGAHLATKSLKEK